MVSGRRGKGCELTEAGSILNLAIAERATLREVVEQKKDNRLE
jgi:hypothetical protein